jgi:hypothetical protein
MLEPLASHEAVIYFVSFCEFQGCFDNLPGCLVGGVFRLFCARKLIYHLAITVPAWYRHASAGPQEGRRLLRNPSAHFIGQRKSQQKMDKCSKCGVSAQVYENGRPVCAKCSTQFAVARKWIEIRKALMEYRLRIDAKR